MNAKWLRAAPLLVMLLLAMALAGGLFTRSAPPRRESPLIGKPLPMFNLPMLGYGNKAHFSPDLWRGRVAVLNVFASWCVPCAAERPALMSLTRSGAEVYGLAWKDKPEKISAWLQAGDPYRLIGLDHYGQTTIPLALTGVPETFVIDRYGRIAWHTPAPLTQDMVTQTLLPLLAQLNGNAK